MDQYLIIALIVIGFWLLGFIVYLILSNKQRDIELEINQIDLLLEVDNSSSRSEL
jgi:hypothetical protein